MATSNGSSRARWTRPWPPLGAPPRLPPRGHGVLPTRHLGPAASAVPSPWCRVDAAVRAMAAAWVLSTTTSGLRSPRRATERIFMDFVCYGLHLIKRKLRRRKLIKLLIMMLPLNQIRVQLALVQGDSPSKESTVVNKQLSEEEKTHFERTLEGFEETLAKSPYDPAALQGAAVSLVELGEYEKASGLLEKLVKVIPDKAEAYRLLGEVKIELQDYEGSSSSYRNSLSSSDNIDFEVLRGLTNSLVAAKKPDQAVEVILSCRRKLNEKSQIPSADRKAANDNGAQKPKDIDPIQVDLLLGKTYSDWGRISDAVTVYDKLITEHPEDFRGYLAKGIILKQNGKAGEAERMFIQAKFFAPEAAKALVDIYAQR